MSQILRGELPEGYDQDAIDRVSAQDKAWFSRHPSRRFRIRLSQPREWYGPDRDCKWTLVASYHDAVRFRIPFDSEERPPNTDDFAQEIWDDAGLEFHSAGIAMAEMMERGP